MEAKCCIVSWDWKGEPDFEEIQQALEAVFNGINCPTIQTINHSTNDQCAVIASSHKLSEPTVVTAWDEFCNNSLNENQPFEIKEA